MIFQGVQHDFNICMHCETMTAIRLINTSPHMDTLLGEVVRALKIYTLSKLQVYSAVWLTTVATPSIGSPKLSHLINETLYPLKTSLHFPHPSAPGSLHSFSGYLGVQLFQTPHANEVIQSLSYCVWLISLSELSSRLIHIVFASQSFLISTPFPSLS